MGAVAALVLIAAVAPAARAASYPMIQTSFELPQVQGNPFDFTQNDVEVTFTAPDGGTRTVPAFFDGGHTWRARHTPETTGNYSVSAITLNGKDAGAIGIEPREFSVAGAARPGFVRIDPQNKMRFIFDDGSPYYAIGYNLGWRGKDMPPLPESLAGMGKAGVNWSRIWMCHWDGKNLDWSADPGDQPPLGQYNLKTAKLWDDIVAAADAADVHFHLVLQHHGQISTGADPNWQENPWNKANGGWLAKPEDFFTDARAMALTRAKYRYIIARWGYSPAIMAWELFNEVENSDAFKNDDIDAIAAWHAAMARFLRQQDPYHHLVTTSSVVDVAKLWPAMDYYEAHVYPPDVLSAQKVLDADHLDKAYFYGEMGPISDSNPASGDALHKVLWGGIMSGASAGAQYWFWDVVEPNHLQFHFTAARKFVEASGLARQQDMKPIDAGIETPQRGALSFGPGMGWAPATATEFTVRADGSVEGLGGMASYLHAPGKNQKRFPFAIFHVKYPAPGTFGVEIDQVTPQGANLKISLDGSPEATLKLGPYSPPPRFDGKPVEQPDPRPDAMLQINIPAGRHTIRLENTDGDWAHLRQFVLDPYAPQLGVLAKAGKSLTVFWVFNRTPDLKKPVAGTLRLPGLMPGTHKVTWMDTRSGAVVSQQDISVGEDGVGSLDTPGIATDLAGWVSGE
jgi:hypothetical protein